MNRLYSIIMLFGLSVLSASADGTRANIAPLLTCQWGQDAPYNSMCPSGYPTGCTATATAQIMYYYRYPEHGTGSITYTLGSVTRSTDFSQSTYQWDAMLDKVTTSSPSDAKDAVALLMKDIGYGTKMNYQRVESVGYQYDAGYALATYFGYDKGVNFCLRKMYSDEEWDDLIYSELAAGRPVVYSGYSQDGSSGHTFVCDGYMNGSYHINWGWDGLYDGYFTFDELMNYNCRQEALIGIQPDKGTKAFPTTLYNFQDFQTENSSYAKSGNVKFMGEFVNRSLETKTFRYGVEFVSPDGTSTFAESTQDNQRAPLSYYENYQVAISLFPTKVGTYTVYPAYRDDQGEWHRMRTDREKVGYVTCKIAFSKITFTQGTVDIYDMAEDPTPSLDPVIYTLDGRRLSRIPDKGVYIENGKKKIRY